MVVLDNGSTDGSYELISEFLGKGVLFLERLWTEKYEWQLILGKPYELVLKYNPEWVVHCDADEFLECPQRCLTLKEAIELEAGNGYNLIQFNNLVLAYGGRPRQLREGCENTTEILQLA